MSYKWFVYTLVIGSILGLVVLALVEASWIGDNNRAIKGLRHQNTVLRDQVEDSVVDINERLTLDEREIRKYDDCVDAVEVSQVYTPALFTQCVKDIEQSQG